MGPRVKIIGKKRDSLYTCMHLQVFNTHQVAPMIPPPPPQQQSPSTAAARCFCWALDYFFKEIDDGMAERKADALLVAASVIAAMNYQAALSPPGGAYQDTRYVNGTIEYQAGQAIAAYVSPFEYKRFSVANTVSFTCSMTTMFLFLSGLSLRRRIFSLLLTASMFATITASTYSYKMAMEATTPDHTEFLKDWRFVNRLVTGALITWFILAGVTIVVFVLMLLKPPVTAAYRRAILKT